MPEPEESDKNVPAKNAPAEDSEKNQPKAVPPPDKSKEDQPTSGSRADTSKADESKKDESSDVAASDALKRDQPTPVLSVEDSKNDQLFAGASADESKIDQLIAVNRELGIFLEEQLDAVLSLRKSVESLESFIENDVTLKKKYEKYLKSVDEGATTPPDLQKFTRLRGIFGRLQRFGTL